MKKQKEFLFTQLVKIHGSGSELQGVGRLQDGRAVFVPGALPGETVEIGITRDGGRFCEAQLISVSGPSPHRKQADCPYCGECGGCAARHMDYAYSLELKRTRVYDALVRVGGCDQPDVRNVTPCSDPDRTRNKAEYAVKNVQNGLHIGCLAAGSHDILDIRDCLQQDTLSVKTMNAFREIIKSDGNASNVRYFVTRVSRAEEVHVTVSCQVPIRSSVLKWGKQLMSKCPFVIGVSFCQLKTRPSHALDGICENLIGSAVIMDKLCGIGFELSPQSFFQVNPPQAEKLYGYALEAAGIAEGCEKRVLDAYCGAGTITLAAVKRGAYAVGVEIVAPAIENAKANAKRAGLADRARFICGDAAREIPKLISRGEKFDAVILDPPRKGADAALLNAIADVGIPVVSYVSCDPGTLARDVKLLTGRGYRLEWAQPVDMFPWTAHVETVVLLSKVHTPGV